MIRLNSIKKYRKSILLALVFTLLTVSIIKNLTEIYPVSTARQQEELCVPIIMYHQVKNSRFGKNTISPSELESDLKYLTGQDYTTITMSELIDYVYEGKELPKKPIILSFDDGYLSTYRYVYPLLKKYNMKIVLSIIGKSIDDFTRVKDENINYSHMAWDQVCEMENSGYAEIQNHTYNLHRICNGRYGCSQMYNEPFFRYEAVLEEDLVTLQDKISEYIDNIPNTFTYPYGKYNENTDKILKKLGFKASLSVTYGVNLISRDDPDSLFGLKRICRAHNQNLEKLIEDAMATLKYADK